MMMTTPGKDVTLGNRGRLAVTWPSPGRRRHVVVGSICSDLASLHTRVYNVTNNNNNKIWD
ncbi:MAG: hypothetical protein ABGY24_02090, partial [bacterium]